MTPEPSNGNIGISAVVVSQKPARTESDDVLRLQAKNKPWFNIKLDQKIAALFAVFAGLRKVGIQDHLYAFGGCPRDLIHDRAYSDIDVFLKTSMSRDEIAALIKKYPTIFVNYRCSPNKSNLITLQLDHDSKLIDVDITIAETIQGFKPFLDSHAIFLDEQGKIVDPFNVTDPYNNLKGYQNRDKVYPLCSKEELIELFKSDPVAMLKAIKESVKIGKPLHENILEAIDIAKEHLKNLSLPQFIGQLASVAIDESTVIGFLKAIEKCGVRSCLFRNMSDQALSDTAIDWVASTAMKMKKESFGHSLNPFHYFIAPLLIAYHHEERMYHRSLRENCKYMIYFSMHTAFKAIYDLGERYHIKDKPYLRELGETAPFFIKEETVKNWITDIFLGLYFILNNSYGYHIEKLKNIDENLGYLPLNPANFEDNFEATPRSIIGFQHFNQFSREFTKFSNKYSDQEIIYPNFEDGFFMLLRLMFVYNQTHPGVMNFCAVVRTLVENMAPFPQAGYDSWGANRNHLVQVVGKFAAHFIDYDFMTIERAYDNFNEYLGNSPLPLVFPTQNYIYSNTTLWNDTYHPVPRFVPSNTSPVFAVGDASSKIGLNIFHQSPTRKSIQVTRSPSPPNEKDSMIEGGPQSIKCLS